MHTLARRVNRIGFGGWSVSKHRVNRVTRRLEINLVKVVRYQKGPSFNTHCEHMSIHIIFLSFVEWANQFSNQSVRSRWPNLRRFFNLAQISQNMLHSTVLSIFSLLRWRVHAQDSGWTHFLGDLSQREKLSEIKPPLRR